MKVVVLPRGRGKTSSLLAVSSEKGLRIVCFSVRECRRLYHLSNRNQIEIPFPITYYEFVTRRYHGNGKGFCIDNFDLFIEYIFGRFAKDGGVEVVSMSYEWLSKLEFYPKDCFRHPKSLKMEDRENLLGMEDD